MTEATARRAFAALVLVCIIGAGTALALGAVARDSGEKATRAAVARAAPSVGQIRAGTEPYVAFRDQDAAHPEFAGRLAVAPLAGGKVGTRRLAGPQCARLDLRERVGLCLGEPGVTGFSARILDAGMKTAHSIHLAGLPSRSRISPDERWAGVTAFVSGHSYQQLGKFSTQATILDLASGRVVGDLERDFRVEHAGHVADAPDRNFWGLTFAADGDTFYATMATGGTTYLIKGSIRDRSAVTIHENVECPSLSPDGTRIGYKKVVRRVKGSAAGVFWRFAVLDLSSGEETLLSEPLSLDDQLEWLDDEHVLYHSGDSTFVMAADGSGSPREFLAGSDSLVVVQPGGRAAAG